MNRDGTVRTRRRLPSLGCRPSSDLAQLGTAPTADRDGALLDKQLVLLCPPGTAVNNTPLCGAVLQPVWEHLLRLPQGAADFKAGQREAEGMGSWSSQRW